jgi:hypothetical protein
MANIMNIGMTTAELVGTVFSYILTSRKPNLWWVYGGIYSYNLPTVDPSLGKKQKNIWYKNS